MPRERGERLRHGLLVADVGEHVAEDRQPAPGVSRDVEASLVHERQQAQRAERDGLAARVRAGDQERPEVGAQLHVNGHHAARQARMAGTQQDDLRANGHRRAGRVHLLGKARLGAPQVKPRQRTEQLAERPGLAPDQRRQLVEDPLDLLLGCHLRLAPHVAQLDGHEWLHEERLPAPGGVMDNPLDAAPGISAHRQDVAAIAERDDRILERGPHVRRVDHLL